MMDFPEFKGEGIVLCENYTPFSREDIVLCENYTFHYNSYHVSFP